MEPDKGHLMSRKLAFAATAAVLAAVAGPAAAWPFGKKDGAAKPPAAEARPAAAPATGPAKGMVPAVAPVKASPAERAAADRLDPLARAAFWANEAGRDPTDVEAGVKLSVSLRALGRHEEAAAAASQVLVTHPAAEEALLELARANIARGQAFYAIDPARRAAAAAPRDWRPLSLLGVAYDQVSRPEDARQAWQQALKLSPDNPTVLSNLAMSYAGAGDAAQAEALLRKAAVQPGASMQVRQNLALVLGLQGKTAEAERLIREDLPPEMAEQNLAWLKQQTSARTAGARTWEGVQRTN
jgi:Flp pilus assembly protein TadD